MAAGFWSPKASRRQIGNLLAKSFHLWPPTIQSCSLAKGTKLYYSRRTFCVAQELGHESGLWDLICDDLDQRSNYEAICRCYKQMPVVLMIDVILAKTRRMTPIYPASSMNACQQHHTSSGRNVLLLSRVGCWRLVRRKEGLVGYWLWPLRWARSLTFANRYIAYHPLPITMPTKYVIY